jgi:hypothetical protein
MFYDIARSMGVTLSEMQRISKVLLISFATSTLRTRNTQDPYVDCLIGFNAGEMVRNQTNLTTIISLIMTCVS